MSFRDKWLIPSIKQSKEGKKGKILPILIERQGRENRL